MVFSLFMAKVQNVCDTFVPCVSFSRILLAVCITHSPRNREEMGSIPGTDRHIVACMTT